MLCNSTRPYKEGKYESGFPWSRDGKRRKIAKNHNNSRPWVFPGRDLPALSLHYHRTPDCSTILSTRLPLVWAPLSDHIRPGPSFHFAFWKGSGEGARDHMKHVNGIPPPDGWSHGAKEPRTGAASVTGGDQSGRLEQRVAPPDSDTQQRGKLHD
jgi:hypothetical protein